MEVEGVVCRKDFRRFRDLCRGEGVSVIVLSLCVGKIVEGLGIKGIVRVLI